MEERRISKRNHLFYYLNVYDQKTDKQIGRIIDISEEGFMLIHKDPMDTDMDYELKMQLPKTVKGVDSIEFEAQSIWCAPDTNPDYYDTGFRFQNLNPQKSKTIQRSLRGFMFMD